MFGTMRHKRNCEQTAKSCKRIKTSTCNYDVEIHEQKAVSGVEINDNSSVSSAESCENASFIFPGLKIGANEISCKSKPELTKYLALDCEMVGVGEQRASALARCSLVNYYGEIVYDTFVIPDQPVTDYRTKWSGVRKSDLKNAIPFKKARKEVKKIIKNSIIIGHSLHCDLHALNLSHHLLRDTALYRPIRLLAGLLINNRPSLKDLSSILLNRTIQADEHCSVEDARAALSLYQLCEQQWEKEINGELPTQSFLSDLYWPSWTRNEDSG